ncbi:MAG: hypothetical protein NC033_02065 [Clostridiales bacterium]|nr:hypothetical protein [Clostridiales bacterium]
MPKQTIAITAMTPSAKKVKYLHKIMFVLFTLLSFKGLRRLAFPAFSDFELIPYTP